MPEISGRQCERLQFDSAARGSYAAGALRGDDLVGGVGQNDRREYVVDQTQPAVPRQNWCDAPHPGASTKASTACGGETVCVISRWTNSCRSSQGGMKLLEGWRRMRDARLQTAECRVQSSTAASLKRAHYGSEMSRQRAGAHVRNISQSLL